MNSEQPILAFSNIDEGRIQRFLGFILGVAATERGLLEDMHASTWELSWMDDPDYPGCEMLHVRGAWAATGTERVKALIAKAWQSDLCGYGEGGIVKFSDVEREQTIAHRAQQSIASYMESQGLKTISEEDVERLWEMAELHERGDGGERVH